MELRRKRRRGELVEDFDKKIEGVAEDELDQIRE